MRKQYFSSFFLFFLCIPYLFSIFFANFARDFIKRNQNKVELNSFSSKFRKLNLIVKSEFVFLLFTFSLKCK